MDRLLASPHYGERWARPWLDLARYADTNGYEKDRRRTMWQYRDWVIDALNATCRSTSSRSSRSPATCCRARPPNRQIATGFHRNTMFNEEGGIDKEESQFEVLVDRVNTTGDGVAGQHVRCAQCHNHKYDPFSQKEYYQLMAFFANSARDGEASSKGKEPVLDLATPEQEQTRKKLKAEIDALEARLKTQTPQLGKGSVGLGA